MRKIAVLMAFLGLFMCSSAKAETLVGFLDGNMYDQSTGTWKCFYLGDGNCYDLNQNVIATRPVTPTPTQNISTKSSVAPYCQITSNGSSIGSIHSLQSTPIKISCNVSASVDLFVDADSGTAGRYTLTLKDSSQTYADAIFPNYQGVKYLFHLQGNNDYTIQINNTSANLYIQNIQAN